MKKCGILNNILCIDIVNPHVKSLGFMDIMSDSKEKTPTVSPDPGATGETANQIEMEKGSVQDAHVICLSVSRRK